MQTFIPEGIAKLSNLQSLKLLYVDLTSGTLTCKADWGQCIVMFYINLIKQTPVGLHLSTQAFELADSLIIHVK